MASKERVKTRVTVDWISATTGLDSGLSMFLQNDFERISEKRPIGRYDEAWELRCGGSLMRADNAKLKGWHFQLTGKSLKSLRDSATDEETLKRIVSHFERVTRIDIALDIIGAGKPKHVLNHYHAGLVQTRLRADTYYKSLWNENADTMYFGSRHSDTRIRIYNKAKEMGLLNEAWTRVELQKRKKLALALTQDALTLGVDLAGRSAIKETLDCPSLAWYRRALSGDTAQLTEVPRSMPNWQKWLLEQVLPSIVKHSYEQEHIDFIREWSVLLSNHLERLQNSEKRA